MPGLFLRLGGRPQNTSSGANFSILELQPHAAHQRQADHPAHQRGAESRHRSVQIKFLGEQMQQRDNAANILQNKKSLEQDDGNSSRKVGVIR